MEPPLIDPGFGVQDSVAVDPLPPSCMRISIVKILNECVNKQMDTLANTVIGSGYTGVNCDVGSVTMVTETQPNKYRCVHLPHPRMWYQQTIRIPYNCAEWYDGCNHCQVVNGQMTACTRMMCFTQRPSECLSYNRLNLGDVCYRFCENGSEQTVNLKVIKVLAEAHV